MSDQNPITGEELAAIKRRCDRATPGRWWWWTSSGDNPVRLHAGSDGGLMRISDDGGFLLFHNEADEEFITEAHTDLPRCIAEIERLCAGLKAIGDEPEDMCASHGEGFCCGGAEMARKLLGE